MWRPNWIESILLLLHVIWIQHLDGQVYSTYELKDPSELETNGNPDIGLEGYDGGDYGGYGDGDYDKGFYYRYELDKIEPEPVIVECFACHYSKMRTHVQGMPNCNDPFREAGIPTVTCEGMCGRTKTVIGDGEYMLIRSCLPNCKNMYDELSTVECCFGSKCNGAKSASVILQPSWTATMMVLLLIIHTTL